MYSPRTAHAWQDRLRACACGAVIVDDFLPPRELMAYLQQTRLNLHPCHYDAYGMTVVEGAYCSSANGCQYAA
jgi:hypothetical protein